MAKAKQNTEVVSIELTLTKLEAETLLDVCGLIGGAPLSTRRGFMDNIAYALRSVDVAPSLKKDNSKVNNSIWFT